MRWSVKQMRAVFERKVWSECENGEWNWGETLILAPHTPYACEARTHPRLRRFATSDLEKKRKTVYEITQNGTKLSNSDK